jgi:hypothetical protein
MSDKNESWFEICEVFYNDKKVPMGHTGGIAVVGENVEELKITLNRMLKCLEDPVLKPEDFTGDLDDEI